MDTEYSIIYVDVLMTHEFELDIVWFMKNLNFGTLVLQIHTDVLFYINTVIMFLCIYTMCAWRCVRECVCVCGESECECVDAYLSKY